MHAILPFIFLAALAAPPQFNVQLLDGAKVSGSLVQWDAAKVTIETANGRRELDVSKVASIAAHAPPAKPGSKSSIWIDLANGCNLAAQEYTTEQGRAKISLPNHETFEVPVADIQSVRMQPESEATAIEWSRIRGKNLRSDVLVTGNQTAIDFHQGAIEGVTPEKVRFTLDGKTLGVKRAKVYGLIYYHAASAPAAETSYTIVDAAGSRWVATKLKLLDGNKLQLSVPGGFVFYRGLDQITQIDLSCGKIVYLSDLKPDTETFTPSPFTLTKEDLPSRAQFSRVRRDENLESKSLRILGQIYRKGMALRSRSELAWTLPGKFSRLEAAAGIDDDVRPLGSVHLQITGDGKSLFDRVISGNDKQAALISLDVSSVRRLVLIVDSQGNFGAGDLLDLGNLRLIK